MTTYAASDGYEPSESAEPSTLDRALWSETEQHVTELASEVLGPDALSGDWARDRVYSRALSIAGGTTQVNKNILAQRMLGLPRK